MKNNLKKTTTFIIAFVTTLILSGCFSVVTGTWEGYHYRIKNREVTITRYSGDEIELTIPSLIDECPVVSIGYEAFYDNRTLKTIIIPKGVESLSDYAFYSCISLSSITIPNGVTSIGRYAFYNCTSLKSITLPDSLTFIGGNAFNECSGLTTFRIPKNVKKIESQAFDNCTHLPSIYVDPDNQYYSSMNGVLFDQAQTILMKYPEGNTKTSYTIPSRVISIEKHAFRSPYLTSISIPLRVTSIHDEAFDGCINLASFNVDGNNEYYSSMSGVLFNHAHNVLMKYPEGAPYSIYTIPPTVTTIGQYAFNNCLHLTSIIIPDNVTRIKEYAFNNCSSLTSITIPDSITIIQRGAFANCSNLQIYTEAIRKPLGWNSGWNPDDRPVTWGNQS
ncbi:MAG: leucine-rich repeat domain-containing protein [Bacilli bacterium]|nr:leucine-rich repeat domain-containing protein [Bacilli bacterium]